MGISVKDYITTENMLQDFQGVVNAKSVPVDINVTAYHCGDILLSNIRPYLKKAWKADRDGGCSADVFVLKVREGKCSPDFLYHIIANDAFISYVMSGAKGVKMPRGDKEQICKYKVSLPTFKEQHTISTLLSLLDERIATQSKIIEDLELLNLRIYHRVFSAMKGKTVALKSVANIIKGKQLNGTELSDNGDYYVMNGGIVPSGYYHAYNAPANTISISEGGNSCGYVQFNNLPFWSGGHCYTLKMSSTDIDLTFLYHYLKHKEKDIMSLRIGSGLPNIQKKDLGNFPILLPAIDEQEKAVCLFDALQQKVEIETKLHNHFFTQKQYLLRHMFI